MYLLATDEQYHYSVKGTVIDVPEKLIFREKPLIPKPTPEDIKQMRELNAMSVSYNTDMDLAIGDRVLFSYRAHFEKESKVSLMDYDLIVAKLDPIRPINGFLLVEMFEKPAFEEVLQDVFVYNEDQNDYGYATVKYAAPPLKGYLDYPEAEDDPAIKEGSVVCFKKGRAVRMELDVHNSLTNKQSSLFRLHRKDVVMYDNG